MQNVLITGGAGFIGSHLAESLLNRDCRVTVIDNLSTGRFENIAHLTGHPNFRYAIDTITQEVVMDRIASEMDTIFHLAAAVGVELIVRDPVHTIETNVMGTEAVLKAALRYRAKVLIASTSEVYGKGNHAPFREDDDVLLGPTSRSRWAYAASKMVDEFLALAYHQQKGLPVVIFRLFNTVGPRQTGQYGMVVPRFIKQALGGEPLTVYGDGQQTRCFCNVEDAIRAIIDLANCPEAIGKVFNVGSTEKISILDLAKRVLALVDGRSGLQENGNQLESDQQSEPLKDDRIVYMPYDQAYKAGFEDMRHRMPDISKIKTAIGWEPKISLDETLRQIIRSCTDGGQIVQNQAPVLLSNKGVATTPFIT